jgi:hypothetical protein
MRVIRCSRQERAGRPLGIADPVGLSETYDRRAGGSAFRVSTAATHRPGTRRNAHLRRCCHRPMARTQFTPAAASAALTEVSGIVHRIDSRSVLSGQSSACRRPCGSLHPWSPMSSVLLDMVPLNELAVRASTIVVGRRHVPVAARRNRPVDDIPAGDVTTVSGGTAITWPVASTGSGHFPSLNWNVEQPSTTPKPAPTPSTDPCKPAPPTPAAPPDNPARSCSPSTATAPAPHQ